VRPTLRGDLPKKGDRYDPVVYGNEMNVFCLHVRMTSEAEIFIEGGVSALNLETMTWHEVETIGTGPCVRYNHATALFNDQMFIIGGKDSSHYDLGDAWSLDLRTLHWKALFQDNRDEPGPSGGCLYAVRSKGALYVLCTRTGSLWSLGQSGLWTLIARDSDMNFTWFTGNDEMLVVVADSGTFSWDWESSCWTQLNEHDLPDSNETYVDFSSQQTSSSIFWFLEDRSLKYLGMEKQWLTVFDSHSVPLCISEELSTLYSMFSYKGIIAIVGWDKEKDENAVWLLSIPYHSSSDLHSPGSNFLKLIDSPYTDFKLVPKEGIEQAVLVIKSVLAVRWKWFSTVLQSGMQEVSSGLVRVPKSRDVVVALVKYLYGGCLPPSLPVKTLVGLARLADLYQLSELAELSSLALRNALSDDNCIKIFRCGVKAHDSMLRWFATDYIVKHFGEICLTQEYARLILDPQVNEAFSTHFPPNMKFIKKRKKQKTQA